MVTLIFHNFLQELVEHEWLQSGSLEALANDDPGRAAKLQEWVTQFLGVGEEGLITEGMTRMLRGQLSSAMDISHVKLKNATQQFYTRFEPKGCKSFFDKWNGRQ